MEKLLLLSIGAFHVQEGKFVKKYREVKLTILVYLLAIQMFTQEFLIIMTGFELTSISMKLINCNPVHTSTKVNKSKDAIRICRKVQ